MKPAMLIQLALLILAGAFITYHFVAFPTTLLIILIGISVVLFNGALVVKMVNVNPKSHS